MDGRWGWPLAVLGVAVGGWQWGWQGVVLGITLVVFWLLLQFSRALRVMKNTAGAPKGQVGSAVMLHSKLRPGLTLLQILPLTGSLGEALPPEAGEPTGSERFAWTDASGARVALRLQAGKLADWALTRPEADADTQAQANAKANAPGHPSA